MFGRKSKLKSLEKKLEQLSRDMERSRIRDYICYLEQPKKLFFSNFLAGLARGFGASIGFTLLASLILYFLKWVVEWNLPVIGKFISEIVYIVENNLRNDGR